MGLYGFKEFHRFPAAWPSIPKTYFASKVSEDANSTLVHKLTVTTLKEIWCEVMSRSPGSGHRVWVWSTAVRHLWELCKSGEFYTWREWGCTDSPHKLVSWSWVVLGMILIILDQMRSSCGVMWSYALYRVHSLYFRQRLRKAKGYKQDQAGGGR